MWQACKTFPPVLDTIQQVCKPGILFLSSCSYRHAIFSLNETDSNYFTSLIIKTHKKFVSIENEFRANPIIFLVKLLILYIISRDVCNLIEHLSIPAWTR